MLGLSSISRVAPKFLAFQNVGYQLRRKVMNGSISYIVPVLYMNGDRGTVGTTVMFTCKIRAIITMMLTI